MSGFYIIGTRPWLNWIECVATDHEVGGSSPPGRTITLFRYHSKISLNPKICIGTD